MGQFRKYKKVMKLMPGIKKNIALSKRAVLYYTDPGSQASQIMNLFNHEVLDIPITVSTLACSNQVLSYNTP